LECNIEGAVKRLLELGERLWGQHPGTGGFDDLFGFCNDLEVRFRERTRIEEKDEEEEDEDEEEEEEEEKEEKEEDKEEEEEEEEKDGFV
jgi:hypothetical protein